MTFRVTTALGLTQLTQTALRESLLRQGFWFHNNTVYTILASLWLILWLFLAGTVTAICMPATNTHLFFVLIGQLRNSGLRQRHILSISHNFTQLIFFYSLKLIEWAESISPPSSITECASRTSPSKITFSQLYYILS